MRILLAVGFVLMNVLIYLVMSMLYKRYRLPVLLPALTATFTVVVLLMGFHISYETYMIGGDWINRLLGPAVVSLAYPLYKQRHVLWKNLPAILGGTVTGLMVGMFSGLLMAAGLGFSKLYVLSILPKSITTAVAIQISSNLGGDSSLTSVFVMVAGFTGAITDPILSSCSESAASRGSALAWALLPMPSAQPKRWNTAKSRCP